MKIGSKAQCECGTTIIIKSSRHKHCLDCKKKKRKHRKVLQRARRRKKDLSFAIKEREVSRLRAKKDCDSLSDKYIKKLLKNQYDLKVTDIPSSLIEKKREFIELSRLLNRLIKEKGINAYKLKNLKKTRKGVVNAKR